MLLYDLAALAVPLLIVGVALYVDLLTRRGYGLALLALGLLGLTILTVHDILVVRRIPDSEAFGYNIGIALYFMAGGYFVLLLWLGALVEARSARQRWWLVRLLITAPISVLIYLVIASGLDCVGVDIRLAADLVFIGFPTLVVFAYGVSRCVRPTHPATTRQAATAR